MSESSLPAAGWYPAAHAEGRMQYWDGMAWVPSAETSAERSPFLKRPISRRTGALVAGSALVLGVIIGAAAGGSGSASEAASLTSQVAVLETEADEARSAATEAQTDAARWEDQRDDARAELSALSAELGRMKTDAEAAQAELDARAATIADLEGRVVAQAAPAPVVETAPAPVASVAPVAPAAPAAPVNVSYDNCTAVRNAGAAPIRVGDPGYGKHLDRDGDGVGCE
ncbi:excalibur calcium-binding domain-containing protein [Microbacterium enclense]|uniref:excalibur calcium-binding domain-containing protein n=1 Tax=Microbacterium enclense TaxID=993073 RepID=UPI0036DA6983